MLKDIDMLYYYTLYFRKTFLLLFKTQINFFFLPIPHDGLKGLPGSWMHMAKLCDQQGRVLTPGIRPLLTV